MADMMMMIGTFWAEVIYYIIIYSVPLLLLGEGEDESLIIPNYL